MVLRFGRLAGCVGLAMITALAGCTSSGGNSGSSSSERPSSTPSTPSATSPATTTAPAGSPADAATTQAITHAYELFFDTDTSLDASVKVLQHGATFRNTLAAESNSPSANKVTARVRKVVVLRPDVAQVSFALSSAGTPLLPAAAGFAVRENGTWKVAAQTFCTLLGLEGTAPPACKNKSITALPH